MISQKFDQANVPLLGCLRQRRVAVLIRQVQVRPDTILKVKLLKKSHI